MKRFILAQPLAATKRFDEIQLCFYPMNAWSMYARFFTTGTLPVQFGMLEKALSNLFKVQSSCTMATMMQVLNKLVFRNKANPVYGLSNLYTVDKDGYQKSLLSIEAEEITPEEKGKLQKAYQDSSANRQPNYWWSQEEVDAVKTMLPSIRRKAMEDCYGPNTEHKFKTPDIRVLIETGPSTGEDGDDGTICRLHFYDAATTSYEGLTQLWEAQRSEGMKTVLKLT